MTSSTNVCTAKASYKKIPGLLELTKSYLQWTQEGKKAPSVRVPYIEAASLFCSKEGASQVKLKLGLVGDDAGHNFTFISPQPTASTDRENFKRELTQIISRNRSATDTVTSAASSLPPIVAQAATPSSHASTPRPNIHAQVPSTPRAVSVSQTPRTPTTPSNNPLEDFRLHRKVLTKTPELAALHRDLVISGQITESEFWEGREHLLLAEAAAEGQKRGKPGQLVDPRPQAVAGGDIKIVITPQLVHDIFEEYPVVAKAYNDNVPNKLSEGEFWKRYFQSKLFNSHRASIRSSAAQHVVKDDPIFDRYLQKADDALEPQRQRKDGVETLIDLAATQEDHGETGNEADVTMRAGTQRGALPLIRRFNEHSERLLNSALGSGQGPAAKRRRLDDSDPNGYYSQIDLDDLHDPQSSPGIVLEMQDRQRYFEGRAAVGKEDASQKPDVRTSLKEARDYLKEWRSALGDLKLERKSVEAAVVGMTQNVTSRLEVKVKKNDIPEGLFRQMTTCQTAANEFLRQFWSAMYPSPVELQTLATASPAQKAAKAAKMADYLSKTYEKVDALVRTARSEGVDPARVEIAMKPLLDAVARALAFYSTRRTSR